MHPQFNRIKRNSLDRSNELDQNFSEISNISFRVVLPIEYQKFNAKFKQRKTNANGEIAVIATITLIILLILSAIVFITMKQAKRLYYVWDKY